MKLILSERPNLAIKYLAESSDSLLLFTGQNGVKGYASAPTNKLLSMNEFLKSLEITYRRDIESGRPRVNKFNSRLDKEQKSNNQYYYLTKIE